VDASTEVGKKICSFDSESKPSLTSDSSKRSSAELVIAADVSSPALLLIKPRKGDVSHLQSEEKLAREKPIIDPELLQADAATTAVSSKDVVHRKVTLSADSGGTTSMNMNGIKTTSVALASESEDIDMEDDFADGCNDDDDAVLDFAEHGDNRDSIIPQVNK
jgi:hypothetical protein